jgi:hypothetical protein
LYTKKVPYKDLYDKPQNDTIYFHLFEREVFKLMAELQAVFTFIEKRQQEEEFRTLATDEMIEFYNNFENIVLAAYGTPVNDGLGFDHSDRYKFEDSACFNAYMVMCLTDPNETAQLINGIIPDGLEDIIRTADENLIKAAKEADSETTQAEIASLRAQLAEATARQNPDETPTS